MRLEPLVPGALPVRAPLLKVRRPISFWGGIDPSTGAIIDARHPDRGTRIGGAILALPGTIGSSSSSSVLLELVRVGAAPAAILMVEVDAILLLGLLVAREMGWPAPPAYRCDGADMARLTAGCYLIDGDARLEREGDHG